MAGMADTLDAAAADEPAAAPHLADLCPACTTAYTSGLICTLHLHLLRSGLICTLHQACSEMA